MYAFPASGCQQLCSVAVCCDLLYYYFFHRNIFDKWSQRSRRCPRCRHGHHQRRRKPCARRGEERVLHLDCRGRCDRSLTSPVAPFSTPFLLFCLSIFDHCLLTTKKTTDKEALSAFLFPSFIAFYFSHFLHDTMSIVFGSLQWKLLPFVFFFFILWKSVPLTAFKNGLLSFTFPFFPRVEPQNIPFTHVHKTHILSHVNTVPKTTIEILSMPSCLLSVGRFGRRLTRGPPLHFA